MTTIKSFGTSLLMAPTFQHPYPLNRTVSTWPDQMTPRTLILPALCALTTLYRGIFVDAIQGRPPHWVNLQSSGDGQLIAGAAYEDGYVPSIQMRSRSLLMINQNVHPIDPLTRTDSI